MSDRDVPAHDSQSLATDAEAIGHSVTELAHRLSEPGWATPEAIAALEPAALQRILTAAVSLYAAKIELDGWIAPFEADGVMPVPTASEVCLTTTLMLDAVSVEVFELALWKTWAHSAEKSGADNEVKT